MRQVGDEALCRPGGEHEAGAVRGPHIVARGVDGLQAAIGRDAGKIGERRREGAAGRRGAERAVQRMGEHDAVQPAPTIVVLIGRVIEGRGEGIAGQKVERVLEALEQHEVAPRGGIGDPRHVEER